MKEEQKRHSASPDAPKDEGGKRQPEIPVDTPEADAQSAKPKAIDWDMRGRRPKYMGKSPPTNNQ